MIFNETLKDKLAEIEIKLLEDQLENTTKQNEVDKIKSRIYLLKKKISIK